MTQEAKPNYKQLHDNLTEDYYQHHLLSKEDFDYYHADIFKNKEKEAEGKPVSILYRIGQFLRIVK